MSPLNCLVSWNLTMSENTFVFQFALEREEEIDNDSSLEM